MKCYFCGHDNEVGQTTCSICGRNLDGTDTIIPTKKNVIWSKELLYSLLFFGIGFILSGFVALVLSSFLYDSEYVDYMAFIPNAVGLVLYILSFIYGIKAKKKNNQSVIISILLVIDGIFVFSNFLLVIAFIIGLFLL